MTSLERKFSRSNTHHDQYCLIVRKTLDNNADSLIPAMFAIFITEMIKTPIMAALDVYG
jgi:hypothetical protein